MAKLQFRVFFLSLTLAGIFLPLSSTAKEEFRKKIEREFQVEQNGKFDLAAKYGDVKIKTWDESRITVEVVITVDACSEEDAQRTFDRIRIDFEEVPGTVRARTVIDDESFSFKSFFRRCQVSYSIDYVVNMPENTTLILKNKYGNSFVANLKSDASLDVEYGDLRMEDTKGNLQVHIGYGNAVLGMAGSSMTATVSYGKLRVEESGDVSVVSKYSTFEIERCRQLTAQSKYDRYLLGTIDVFSNIGKYDHIRIGAVRQVTLQTEYTDAQFKEVSGNLTASMRYGGLEIERLKSGFQGITLQGKYTGFRITLDDDASYRLQANTSYGGLSLPQDLEIIQSTEEQAKKSVVGRKTGGAPDANSVIHADLEYGSLNLSARQF